MSSRRPRLEWLHHRSASNAGLWLDKYLDSSGAEDTKAKHDLVEQVAGIAISDAYKTFYKRWRQALEAQGVKPREAEVKGRMVIGLGDESVIETSVTLHHTYGVPFIPGSALKGLAASYARQQLEGDEWRERGKHYLTVFGQTDDAGFITFYDALYIPEKFRQKPDNVGKECPLAADVLTVHHQAYYQDGSAPPADWDDPVPVPFLSAMGHYLIALSGPDEWVEVVFKILQMALRDYGIGAKTSSGYGRLKFIKSAQPAQPPPVQPGAETTQIEEVTLESNVSKNRNAQVKLNSGEVVACSDFPTSAFQQPKRGATCQASVTYRDGKAMKAKYKG